MVFDKNLLLGPPEVMVPAHLSFSKYCLDKLREGGDKIAQINADTKEAITYREILEKSVKLSVSLQRLGLKKGDVVSISSENRFEFTIAALAVMYVGAVNSTLNFTYTEAELTHVFKFCKPKFVFCSPLTATNINEVVSKFSFVERVIVFGDEQLVPGILYEDLTKIDVDSERFEPVDVNGTEDLLAILCSSGTTGLPKGVMLTHFNFLLVPHHLRLLMTTLNEGTNHLALSLIPWFHAYGFFTHLTMLTLNVTMVFMVRFEEEKYLRTLQDYKVNITFLVPPLVVFLAKHPLVSKFDLTALKEVWCGAAPLSSELQMAASKRIGIPPIKQGYGLTETPLALTLDMSGGAKAGSIGCLVPGVTAKVADIETGIALGPHKEGELSFKSPMLMKGYVGDLAATSAMWDSDGFLHTGDIGYYDEDGYFYIIDRIKELIKYKGYQVPPAELEAILLQHAGVRECGVVGLDHETVGQLPVAFVVRQPDSSVGEDELQRFVADRVSPAKRLRGGVRFIAEIPKNPSGKILRRQLRELLKTSSSSKL